MYSGKQLFQNIWYTFYNNIRDASWPDCNTEKQFYSLPDHIQQEILTQHHGAEYLELLEKDVLYFSTDSQYTSQEENYDKLNIEPFWQIDDDVIVYGDKRVLGGGSTTFFQNSIRMVNFLYKNHKFNHCLNWCAGSGVVGFRLLNEGNCKKVTFLEKSKIAVAGCVETIKHLPRGMKYNADAFAGSCLSALPKSYQFDLIIANPPHHHSVPICDYDSTKRSPKHKRIAYDFDWDAHKNFFKEVNNFLTDNGKILLIHNATQSGPDDFRKYIEDNNLKITRVIMDKKQTLFWFLEISR
jgi:methylase of polypeptide subunit release factors